MKRFERICPHAAALAILVWLTCTFAWPSGGWAQQQLALERRPRFLALERNSGKPVEVDITRVAILRRRVALNRPSATIQQLLHEISAQTGIEFAYEPGTIPVSRVVGLRADSITVAAALTEILVDAGVDVLLKSSQQAVLLKRVLPGAITGSVTDSASSHGVTGAEVFLDGTRWRTVTDTAGRYRLDDVEPRGYTLTVRRLGYRKARRQVTVRADAIDTMNVVLAPAAVALTELVTTATGQQRRRDLGNAITTIKADSVLQTAPIRNLTDLLANRVPGLSVQHTSGAPGDPARLRLRGLGSAFRSNDPVVVVDGVRVYAAQSGARSGNLTNLNPATRDSVSPGGGTAGSVRVNPVDVPAPSPLDQIDPNIIEKIEVFKGPSAATLYGADAANGVIVITTKRGKPGPTRWNANVTFGRTSSPGRYPIGYYRWGRDIYVDRPRFCTLTDATCKQDSLVQFQALNEPALTVLGRGDRRAVSLTASGGSQALTYSLTGTYDSETGLLALPAFEVDRFQERFNRPAPDWMRRPHQLDKWSVTSSVTARLGATADVTLSTSLSRADQQRTSLEGQLASLAGMYIDTVNGIYYRPGTTPANGVPSPYVLAATQSVLTDYYVRQTASTISVTTGLNATWHPRAWFSATGRAGINVIPRDDHLLLPSGLVAVADSGAVSRGTGHSLESTFDVQGTAQRPIGLGFRLAANVGANLTSTTTNDLVASASGLLPGTNSIAGARKISAVEQEMSTSVFGWYLEPRISGQRLSLSTGIRLDGGSTYGTRVTGLLGLPKLNGSWVISEEPFFPFKSLFTSLRLRGAYGQAQVQPGPVDRLRLYRGSVTEQGTELALTTLGNRQLRPERSTEFEGGIDADLFESRVSVELTAYHKLQVDAIMPLTLPGSIHGGGSVLTNIGNIRNTGLELTGRITPVQSPFLTWSATLNYARNSNTLLKLGRGVQANNEQGLVEGYPLYGRWARPIITYVDQDGDGVLQPEEIQVGDSLVYMGRQRPAYETALFTDLAFFRGAVRVSAGVSYNAGATQIDQTARANWVLNRALADPSAPLGDQAAVLASTRLDSPTDYGLIQEISTFRFNSLSVNYRAPTRVTRLLGARELTVAVQGANLGLHSTYQGKDPDVSAWSAGESIVDTGQLPQPRTWQLALFLQY